MPAETFVSLLTLSCSLVQSAEVFGASEVAKVFLQEVLGDRGCFWGREVPRAGHATELKATTRRCQCLSG